MKKYKNLLIISHNCLSKTGSNGRTLANLLLDWPKEKIAQFYIHAEQPDFDICSNYYCVTDSSIGRSIVKRCPAGYPVDPSKTLSNDGKDASKRRGKNSFLYLVREVAWRSRLWDRKAFYSWAEDSQPELILIQAGDAGFLFKIAMELSGKFNAPIAIYNTEGYYFKKKSYLPENMVTRMFYPVLNKWFRKAYKDLVNHAVAEVYNCDMLKNDYKAVFQTESHVIMNTSEFTDEEVFMPKKDTMIYAGNLGLQRHKSLIEFAEALGQVVSGMYVDVYGKTSDEEAEKELKACKHIRYHGFIPYSELKQLLRESRYLLHIESFEPFYREDLKYAFSTKIADLLATGACLFVYAPDNMAVSRYLKDKDAAVLITAQEDLKAEIERVFGDPDTVEKYALNGRKLALDNHDILKNRERFQALLLE